MANNDSRNTANGGMGQRDWESKEVREILKECQIKSKFTKAPRHYSKSVDLPKENESNAGRLEGQKLNFPWRNKALLNSYEILIKHWDVGTGGMTCALKPLEPNLSRTVGIVKGYGEKAFEKGLCRNSGISRCFLGNETLLGYVFY